MDQPHLYNMYRETAWQHFNIHAEQRLKMFQFYITISTALLGGGVLILRSGRYPVALMLLSFLAFFFSLVFRMFEARTRALVKNAEDAIKYLEACYDVPDINGEPNPLKLFTRDDFRTKSRKRRSVLSHLSYHKCFMLVFVVIGVLGILGMIYGLSQILCTKPAVELSL